MSSRKKRVLLCVGTRPEVIKTAPVFHALRKSFFEPVVLHTGQHVSGMDELYGFFGMPRTRSLNIVRNSESLSHLTALLMEGVERAISEIDPDAVLVQGDTTSALAGALAAFYQKKPVGHIEAGLRTFLKYEPFPEEKNRELIARLATWHFAPTVQAERNLLLEGIDGSKIHRVGNTVIDAVRWGIGRLQKTVAGNGFLPPELRGAAIQDEDRHWVLVTAHRRENWGLGIRHIAQAVRILLEQNETMSVVWPVHPNPKVQATIRGVFGGLSQSVHARLFLTPPLNYPALLWVLKRAWLVLTDSGGIQEEASETKTPVLILRETTERMELVSAGGARLVGTDPDEILDRVFHLLDNPAEHHRMRAVKCPFGDGFAAQYIADILAGALDIQMSVVEKSESGELWEPVVLS